MDTDLLYDAIERLVRDIFDRDTVRKGASGQWLDAAWDALKESGAPLAMVPENQGGFGIDTADAIDILRLVGYWAIPLPLSETMLALGLLARAGIALPDAVVTLCPPNRTTASLARTGEGWKIEGRATRVPWARHAGEVVLATQSNGASYLVMVPIDCCEIAEGCNLAGEPRDDISFDCALAEGRVKEVAPSAMQDIHAAGAALRTVMIAGAANRVLDMSVEYACEHKQFGRPIAAFQAVQQNLAVIGGQVALCRASGDMAAQALFNPECTVAIAMAKARAGEAASEAVHLGHQVHGAIGYTDEYDLHLYSKRIWAWREEFGNEAEWNEYVGQAAIDHHAGPWALITSQAGQL